MDPAGSRLIDIGAASYRAALRLYPRAFHRLYADELEMHFDDVSEEAFASGSYAALFGAWLEVWSDLPLSVVREWLGTPWPLVMIAAAAVANASLFLAIFRAYHLLQGYRARVAAGVPPPADSPQLLMLMMLMVLVPAACLVVVVVVTNISRRHPRTRGTHV